MAQSAATHFHAAVTPPKLAGVGGWFESARGGEIRGGEESNEAKKYSSRA